MKAKQAKMWIARTPTYERLAYLIDTAMSVSPYYTEKQIHSPHG